MVRRSVVAGCGAYLPDRVVTNEELAHRVDTTDEWIVQRTGIKTRHIAGDDQKTSDLAIAAARQALEHAGMDASELDWSCWQPQHPTILFRRLLLPCRPLWV